MSKDPGLMDAVDDVAAAGLKLDAGDVLVAERVAKDRRRQQKRRR